jgi:hypothetical protein
LQSRAKLLKGKNEFMRLMTFIWRSLPIIIPLIFLTSQSVLAVDIDNCLLCHKYPGLGIIDESGKKHLYYVNEELYDHSVHQNVTCKECHIDIEKIPHTVAKKVNCAEECHAVDPSTKTIFSHAETIEKYELSVHGKGTVDDPIKYADDLPGCTYCHKNRILKPFMALPDKPFAVAQEIIDRCRACHKDQSWARMYYSHMTHRLKPRRTSRKMVELCASCHEDTQKMKRHGLEATGTFRDTFHWQAIKFGDKNAPNCIDCHAPVGFFSHEIMPKSTPQSSIHKDNLVRTCSNPSGLHQCHPGATPEFAQGKIHPSGIKARLFDTKLDTYEQKELIKKGEINPFQSIMAEKAQEELTSLEYYQALVIKIVKYFYKLLIGGLIGVMIVHQILDYFMTRKEIRKGGHR